MKASRRVREELGRYGLLASEEKLAWAVVGVDWFLVGHKKV